MEIHPLTPERWPHLEELFGARGAFGGCWCLFTRQSSAEFDAGRGEPNRRALRALVDHGSVPGLLAYFDGRPVGWVSLGRREEFGRIQRSRVTKPVDGTLVWSVVCFVIDRHHRRRGVAGALLTAAVEYARRQGAVAVEGYPVDPPSDAPDVYVWQGLASMFRKAGFVEVARRSPTRPLMRKML